jgi:hypothetical protein
MTQVREHDVMSMGGGGSEEEDAVINVGTVRRIIAHRCLLKAQLSPSARSALLTLTPPQTRSPASEKALRRAAPSHQGRRS